MVIWYYNHYSGGRNSAKNGRSFYLTKALLNQGQSPAVIAASFHHLMNSNEKNIEPDFVKGDVSSVPFLWLKTPRYEGNGLSRFKNMFSYAYKTWKYDFVKEKVLTKPDVIIISSVHPFHLFAGLKWARKYNAKLAFEVRDLWPLSLSVLLGLSKWHPLYFLLSFIERLGYKKADLVMSPLINAREYMGRRGLDDNRFLYLPNGFISDFNWDSRSVLTDQLSNIRKQYPRIIMHTGSMGIPNGLKLFIEVANKFKGNLDIAFVLVGNGGQKKNLKALNESSHTYFFDSVAKSEVLSLLAFADVCYCGSQDHSELYKFGVSPNKIFDYMLAKKTIILAVDSPNNPVELSGAGFCIQPSGLTPLVKVINAIIDMPDKELHEKGQAGYKFLQQEHDFDLLAQKLVGKLESL